MKKQIKKLETDGIGIFMFSPVFHEETRDKINEIIDFLNQLKNLDKDKDPESDK